MGRVADVEMNEFQFPMLYLWRREEPDSGGPGRYRGGLGASSCFVLHDTPIKSMHLVVSAAGKAIPQASGISGGYPGNQQYDVLVRGSDVRAYFASGRIPGELEQLRGEMQIVQPELETDMDWDDIYYTHWQAGGGLGDPLLRDPELVAADLAGRKISEKAAREIYGVVLRDDGQADLNATERWRGELRQRRAGGEAMFVRCDVGDSASCASMARAAGIRVNAITPGPVYTEVPRETVTEAQQQAMLEGQCLKRLAGPDDRVGTVAFLISDDSAWITGQTINVDGGLAFP